MAIDPAIVQLATLALAALAAIFALFAFVRINRYASHPALTGEAVTGIVRGESEVLRRSVEDGARAGRAELQRTLAGFQDGNRASFGSLNDFLGSRLTDFSGRLDGNVVTLRETVESRLDDVLAKQATAASELRRELEESFARLQTRVTGSLTEASEGQKERLADNNAALERLRLGVESRLDAIRQENTAKLDEMRQTVDEKLQATLENRLGESFSRIVEQLKSMHEGIGEMKKLAANVGDLQKVLTNVKVRGTYGEVQLEALLEEFLSADQFMRNCVTREGSAERVEFAIRLPGRNDDAGVLLPVDSKFPREDYDHLIAASEEGDAVLVAHFRKQLESRIRQSARDIRDKYINPPRTTDFAILFIPTESLYAEVLRQPGLFEQIQRECRVTMASPTTLAALLNALQMGFRTLAIEKRSSEVWQILGAVRSEFGKYNDVVGKLERQLNTAQNSVSTLGRRTRAMTRTLRGVDVLTTDPAAADRLLGIATALEESDAGEESLEYEMPPAHLNGDDPDAAERP